MNCKRIVKFCMKYTYRHLPPLTASSKLLLAKKKVGYINIPPFSAVSKMRTIDPENA